MHEIFDVRHDRDARLRIINGKQKFSKRIHNSFGSEHFEGQLPRHKIRQNFRTSNLVLFELLNSPIRSSIALTALIDGLTGAILLGQRRFEMTVEDVMTTP